MVDENNELQPTGESALVESSQRPAWMEVTEGSAEITAEDIRLPRLAIAQGLSPQMVPDSSQTIDGLRLFELFNDVTGEIYGRGPLKFIPIFWQVKNIEFEIGPDGKPTSIIVDDNVPSGDPRTKWTKDADGNKVRPRATRYTELVVKLLHPGSRLPETIIISVKETNKHNRRAAKIISGALVEIPRPYYGGIYAVKSVPEKFDKGTAGIFVFATRPTLWNSNSELYAQCKQLAESLQGKTIVVEREAPAHAGDEDTSFDTTAMEAEIASEEAV